jgi:hypothetical protein
MTHDPEAILERISAIEADMVAIMRVSATQGDDLRSEWDKLFAERTALEMKLWEMTPHAAQRGTPLSRRARAMLWLSLRGATVFLGIPVSKESDTTCRPRDRSESESMRALRGWRMSEALLKLLIAGLEKDVGRFVTPDELEKVREHVREADEREQVIRRRRFSVVPHFRAAASAPC